jgi:ATP-binding cassette, subfamily B, bacterial PglK
MQVVTGIVISTFIIIGLIVINPLVSTIVGVSFVLIYSLISYFSRKLLRANSKIWAAAQRTRVKTVQEGLGGLRDVIIDRTQPAFINHFAEIDYNMRRAGALSAMIGAAPRYLIEALGIMIIAGTALVLASGPGGLVASLPFLGAFAIGAQRLLPLIQNIFQYWTGFASTQQALVDVLEVLDLPLDDRLLAKASDAPIPFEDKIEFANVSFRYNADQKDVLRSISLKIPKGSRVGLIGKTGSGKTTLMDLIMGLLEPTGGTITIDDRQLDETSVRSWQAHLAHVPQMIYLADTTIAENIAFGMPVAQIDMKRVREAAKEAELDAFVQTLPLKYDTIVGERGIRLSGGQRQRIGIARALYKRADVLVFDEATSALDNETEAAVMEAIESLPGNLTIIMIAHRLSTVAMCDTVIRLEDGRIAEQGDPAKMIGTPAKRAKNTVFG